MLQSLQAKEKKKKNDRTILFPGGFGWHLTDAQFTQQLDEQNQRKEAEAAEKAQRMEGREARKVAKAALDTEWQRIKAEHEAAVEAWEADYQRLRAEGCRPKDLPWKPKCARKPTLPKKTAQLASSSDDEEGSSNSDGDK
jgi:hypothetical protein